MPFIPHTDQEITEMLVTIGVKNIENLFDEIPSNLRSDKLNNVPEALTEMQITQLMHHRANEDANTICFLGAGAYDHHIPAAVWELTTRGEFYSAYTPYQAEASQGTLQLLYEYQSMMCALTAMDVSNASLYDGASGLAEAVLMAIRANRKSKSKRILMPRTVHPNYRKVVKTITKHQGVILEEINFDINTGIIDVEQLPSEPGDIAALVIPQPNFFGALEEINALTDWAHRYNVLVIAVVNPLALAILKPPGEWGETGADIVCGEGQPLGAPLSSGGPYFGFMCCKQALVRQMPGRIIGRTVDLDGKPGFTLTLQAREQHIRRSKATSNICTNQGLLVTAATIHMSLLGPQGLEKVAEACHTNTLLLVKKLSAIEGVSTVFDHALFHEAVLKFELPLDDVIKALSVQGVVAGYDLSDEYPELKNCLLVCATEKRTNDDIDSYASNLERISNRLVTPACPVAPKMK